MKRRDHNIEGIEFTSSPMWSVDLQIWRILFTFSDEDGPLLDLVYYWPYKDKPASSDMDSLAAAACGQWMMSGIRRGW